MCEELHLDWQNSFTELWVYAWPPLSTMPNGSITLAEAIRRSDLSVRARKSIAHVVTKNRPFGRDLFGTALVDIFRFIPLDRLKNFTRIDFLEVHNCGMTTVIEIERWLATYHISLASN